MSNPDYSRLLYPQATHPWLMSHAERAALLHVLAVANPVSAIEVGTAHGGSLEQVRRTAKFVYSIDLNPDIASRLAPEMPNVEFLTGDSKDMIPVALERCAAKGQPLGFALIDGDHRYAGVQADIHALLRYQPIRPLWVLLHDSGNPECRAGIAEAKWAENPRVHAVELDFVPGRLCDDPTFRGMIWGGLALALLLPEPRTGALAITAASPRNQEAIYRASEHPPTPGNYLRKWLRVKKRGLDRRLERLRS